MDPLCDDIADAYEAWLHSWARPKTEGARVGLIRNRLAAWGHPETWTPAQVQTFLTWGTDRAGLPERRPEWTVSTYYSHLHDFAKWCVRAGVIDRDFMLEVRKTAHPSNLPHPLSEAEVGIVLAAASSRQRTWLLLALLAGLRAHEIAKLRGEDIDPELIYVAGKGGKRAAIPTHPELWRIAQDYPRHGYWFPTRGGHVTAGRVSASIGALFDDHGIEGSIHRARHTFGTRLVRAGVDLRRVQTLMRHSNLATTAGYTAVADDGLRDAVRLLPGV
jgi:integrase/recombinase XerD